ncbi:MAG TPA: P-II family nitrogen regulator [Candidatus Faecicola pullistercoris]|nr:P-II family nitrogen regulator [Candidatus Faecicola pullistercoris]
MNNEKYAMIWAIVNKGYADTVMSAARSAGAKGGTIVNARGTGDKDAEKVLGFVIEPEKDLVLIIAERSLQTEILKQINSAAGLSQDGKGIVFALPVDDVVGGSV